MTNNAITVIHIRMGGFQVIEPDFQPYNPPPIVCACRIDPHPTPSGYIAVNAGCKIHAAAIMFPHGWETLSRSKPANKGAARMYQP